MSGANRLSGEDLTFWWADSPTQPTTMAMLLVLDRAPDAARLRLAFDRALGAVPRLRERVVEAPLGLTLPRWQLDPTFDLDYHVRRHALTGSHDLEELFAEVAPAYETPFDRSRPLWEARVYDGLENGRSAVFFKLHHAVADGVGGNAIFGALTDWERDSNDPPPPPAAETGPVDGTGAWPEAPWLLGEIARAVRDRVELDVERLTAIGRTLGQAIGHPSQIARAVEAVRSFSETMRFQAHPPHDGFGRKRRLAGLTLPFEPVRAIKRSLEGTIIDVLLTIMARAMGHWYAARGVRGVRDLMTLVPVNLRPPTSWTDGVQTGNVASGLLVPLPINLHHPLATFREVRRRVEAKKVDPASGASPVLAEILSVFGPRVVSWLGEATFGQVDFIVTNVPGILSTRYLAGAEIVAAYPFAPVAVHSPASIALYGYRDHFYVGIDADQRTMPDVDAFRGMIAQAYGEVADVARVGL